MFLIDAAFHFLFFDFYEDDSSGNHINGGYVCSCLFCTQKNNRRTSGKEQA